MIETAPMKFRDRITVQESLLLEAALCAWEWMCHNRDGDLLKDYFEGNGSAAMRHCAMQAGEIALQTYSHMEAQGYEFADAYDWEFVPGVLRRLDWGALVDDNQYSGPPYQPDLAAIFTAMVAADKCAFVVPALRGFLRRSDVDPSDAPRECLDVV